MKRIIRIYETGRLIVLFLPDLRLAITASCGRYVRLSALSLRKVKAFREKRKQKKAAQNEDVTE
jgi:hypothetical protein